MQALLIASDQSERHALLRTKNSQLTPDSARSARDDDTFRHDVPDQRGLPGTRPIVANGSITWNMQRTHCIWNFCEFFYSQSERSFNIGIAMHRRQKKPQARSVRWHRGIKHREHVDALLQQSVAEHNGGNRVTDENRIDSSRNRTRRHHWSFGFCDRVESRRVLLQFRNAMRFAV